MNQNEIVRYIYEHALGMINPWDEAILELVTKTELTSDGFRIVASEAPMYWVGMKEFMGTIFVQVHERDDATGIGVNFESMASGQTMARKIYDQMVNALLVA